MDEVKVKALETALVLAQAQKAYASPTAQDVVEEAKVIEIYLRGRAVHGDAA